MTLRPSDFRTARRRGPKPNRRRALELLAACPDGATDTLLMADHGLATEMLVDLVRDGLAIAQAEHLIVAGARPRLCA